MGVKKTVIRNVLSNWFTYGITAIVSFFISPFVVHTLGDTAYGIWVLAGSITGYLGLLSFGFPPAIVKFVSRYKALEDDTEVNNIVNTMFLSFIFIGAVALIGSFVLAIFSPDLFVVEPAFHHDLVLIIIIVGATIAISFPFVTFDALINAFQRFDINNLIRVSVFLGRSAFIVLFLKLGGRLITLGLIALAAVMVQYFFQVVWAHKIFPHLKINPRLANKKTLKMIAGFSIYTFIIGISFRISYYTDSIVIGSFLAAQQITFFAIGNNLIMYLMQLVSNITVVLTPLASTFEAKSDFEHMRRLLFVGTRYSMMIILPVAFTFLVLGKPFINLWMGPEYADASSKVLRILTWGYIGALSQLVTGSIFMGLGKIKWYSFLNLANALGNIGLSILLVRKFGIYGVAAGTAIPLGIYGTIVLPIYVCRELKVNIFGYIWRAYVPPILASIPFLIVMFIYNRYLDFSSLSQFFLYILLACMFYAFFAFFIALEKEHRMSLREKIGGLAGRFHR